MRMQTEVAGRGRPLVLVGGGLTGALSWGPHAQRLAATRQVVRPQLVSVQSGLEGRSLPPGYSIQMESEALGAALDDLGLRAPLDLVAWSFGGVVTLDYALGHPERVRTLTLIEPPAVWVFEATGRLDARSRRERDEMRDLHAEMQGDVTEEQLARFAVQAGLCPPGKRPEELLAWPVWVRHRRSLLNGVALFQHREDAERLRRLDRPVLLVKGTGSAWFLHRVVDALAATLPAARVIELPSGHAPQIVSMDAFLAAVEEFQGAGVGEAPAPGMGA